MHKIFISIKNFIGKDVKNEMETKDLAILLRVLCILYFTYYIVLTPFIAVMTYYIVALSLLLAVGSLLSCFILTYEEKTHISVHIFYVTVLLCSSVLTICLGWSLNFQWSYLIILLVTYYNLNTTRSEKFNTTIFVCCFAVATALIALLVPVLRQPTAALNVFIQLITMIFYTLVITVMAYLYSTKFNQSEEKLRQTNEKLLRMASLDTLTQLPNRRSMNDHLGTLIYDYKRTGKEFCVAIGDVDSFKHINDEYGHETGDYILTTLASLFRDAVDGVGFVSRWGGEEFLFTFEGMTQQQAFSKLEILRIQIAEYPFEYKGTRVKTTVTFGIEEYSSILTLESVISRADAKLYQGKASGRNKVVS